MQENVTDYRTILPLPFERINFQQILSEAIENPSIFETIFNLMFDKNEKIAWRSAWICEKISEKHPDYFSEESILRIIELAITNRHTGVQRITLSMLLNLTLPSEIPVELINVCFERMISPKSPTGVQVLSMKILYEISKREPDFKLELKAYLESVDVNDYTTGYRTARKNILKKL